ncbi:conserved hypothetical protein [Cenarchaeum symbiosum A]|uniref:Uncharacterized protein n=1 Tax=Cenarchaeum symbiosum (strain A) TaxID=414004 RepID=A0RYK4_CENSY|nr:conserved hypothetical protein [Cenarchaeum symbiosum A]
MEVDEGLVMEVAGAADALDAELHLLDRTFPVERLRISRESVPVTKRTQRGGSYFADVDVFRARARIRGGGVSDLVPRAMLGPSTEFADVIVIAEGLIGGRRRRVILHTNLTNAVEGPSYAELSLNVTGTEG